MTLLGRHLAANATVGVLGQAGNEIAIRTQEGVYLIQRLRHLLRIQRDYDAFATFLLATARWVAARRACPAPRSYALRVAAVDALQAAAGSIAVVELLFRKSLLRL